MEVLLADFAIVSLVLAPVLALLLLKTGKRRLGRVLAVVLVADALFSCLCMLTYAFLFR